MATGTSGPDLAEAIDALLVCGPAPSPYLRYLELRGVTASLGPDASPGSNRVGLTDVSPAVADELIAAVLATFRREGRGVRWFVSDRSRPTDLARRLEAHGLARGADGDLVGMAATVAAPTSARPPGTEVRSVGLDELRRNVQVMALGFGTTVEASLATLDMLAAGAMPGAEFVQYLAYDGGTAVGFATGLVDHRRRVTLLGGSAVLAAHRGRGHYRALVRERILDARRRGSRAVVAQARRQTSAPILARLGFREVLTIGAYDLPPPHPVGRRSADRPSPDADGEAPGPVVDFAG
jgi:GNAT superfamily N-acetyltransferase